MDLTSSSPYGISNGVAVANGVLHHSYNALTLKEIEKIVYKDNLFISTPHAETILNQTSAELERIKKAIRALLRKQCHYQANEDILFQPENQFADVEVLCPKGSTPLAWHLPLPNAFCAAISSDVASLYPGLFKEPNNLNNDEFVHSRHGNIVVAPWVIRRRVLEKMIFTCSKQMKEEKFYRRTEGEPAGLAIHKRVHSLEEGTGLTKKVKTRDNADAELALRAIPSQALLQAPVAVMTDPNGPTSSQGEDPRPSGHMHERHTARDDIQDGPSTESAPTTASRGQANTTNAEGQASTRAPDAPYHGRTLRPRTMLESPSVTGPDDYVPERNLRSRNLRIQVEQLSSSAPTPTPDQRRITLATQETKVIPKMCVHQWEIAPKAIQCSECSQTWIALMECKRCKSKACNDCRAKLARRQT